MLGIQKEISLSCRSGNNQVNIKLLEKDEQLRTCVEVLRSGFGTVADTFGLTAENCPSNAAFIDFGKLKLSKSKGTLLYGAYIKDNLVGCVGVRHKSKGVFEISKLAVIPSYRKVGIGRELIQFACSEVKKQKGQTLILGMIDSNELLKEWYVKQGFKIVKKKVFSKLPFKVCFLEKKIVDREFLNT